MTGHEGVRAVLPRRAGSEVLAERWTPLILREMVLGSTRFNEIERGLPSISRSLLAKRLRYLARKGATWYDHEAMLIVKEGERVMIYRARGGKPPARFAYYEFAELDPEAPPAGLSRHAES